MEERFSHPPLLSQFKYIRANRKRSKNVQVFVYGSLRKGMLNHHRLEALHAKLVETGSYIWKRVCTTLRQMAQQSGIYSCPLSLLHPIVLENFRVHNAHRCVVKRSWRGRVRNIRHAVRIFLPIARVAQNRHISDIPHYRLGLGLGHDVFNCHCHPIQRNHAFDASTLPALGVP